MEKIIDSTPSLEDRSYERDMMSMSSRWDNTPFRDPITGSLVMWLSPYNMPQGNGWKAIGVYDSSIDTSGLDRESADRDTYNHEQVHAKGGQEYEAYRLSSYPDCRENNYWFAA